MTVQCEQCKAKVDEKDCFVMNTEKWKEVAGRETKFYTCQECGYTEEIETNKVTR